MKYKGQRLTDKDINICDYYFKSGEYLFYTVYYSDSFGKANTEADVNVVPLDSNFSGKGIELKYIIDFLPTYTFCCCYLDRCICNFIIRYKSCDPNGIFPWIWCDISNLEDVAIPFNTAVVLRVFVYRGDAFYYAHDSLHGCDKDENMHILNDCNPEDSNGCNPHKVFDLISNLISETTINPTVQKNIGSTDLFTESSNMTECFPSAVETHGCHLDTTKQRINEEINNWCRKSDGTYKDISVLLSSLHHVLWESAHWEPVEFSKLMTNTELLKRTYRKALILCHPDKHQKEEERHRYKVHQIFMAINGAHKNTST
ncbi:hypothetical protein FG386_002665 [Cryptosporidium ryanae]|uniref:uncharacterized protein n=1 Tax=Cryptosporidium ryanae TaxID=515981 RepID=UPI00351A2000|nr:hypothetical protein FG386_002665 [Cryptosporidium ryanae]